MRTEKSRGRADPGRRAAREGPVSDLRQVKSLEAALSVDYERGDTIMSGDADSPFLMQR